MKVIKQRHEFIDDIDGMAMLKKIERCGRVCYKSEDKITDESCLTFVKNLIRRGHESVLEHCSFTVRFITDRSTTHELVRHRMTSLSQESQRYVCYKGEDIQFILPCNIGDAYSEWEYAMDSAAKSYHYMGIHGCAPQIARSVLPNSTKTEIIVTANLREWRHILKLRTSKAAHPQIRDLMINLLKDLKEMIPVVFDDIEVSELW